MNAYFRGMNARRLHQPAHTAGAIAARMLAAIGLAVLLTACATPGAAQQPVVKVVKAVARAKPISEAAPPAPTATPAPTVTPAPSATPVITAQPVTIGTNGGEWQFDATTLEITAGGEIALTFNNGAKTTAHNWLLVSGGEDVATEVNAAGEQAGVATNYIPDDTRIIAHTAGVVKGGQSETMTFTAPEAGTYVYLCTFPGHFELGMKGVLTVK